jgi:hypothetical protein
MCVHRCARAEGSKQQWFRRVANESPHRDPDDWPMLQRLVSIIWLDLGDKCLWMAGQNWISTSCVRALGENNPTGSIGQLINSLSLA